MQKMIFIITLLFLTAFSSWASAETKCEAETQALSAAESLTDAVSAMIGANPDAAECVVRVAMQLASSASERAAIVKAATEAAVPKAAIIAAAAIEAAPESEADAIIIVVTDVVVAAGVSESDTLQVTKTSDEGDSTVYKITQPGSSAEEYIVTKPRSFILGSASPN